MYALLIVTLLCDRDNRQSTFDEMICEQTLFSLLRSRVVVLLAGLGLEGQKLRTARLADCSPPKLFGGGSSYLVGNITNSI